MLLYGYACWHAQFDVQQCFKVHSLCVAVAFNATTVYFFSSKILIAIEKRVDTNILKAPEACTRRYIADGCL